MSCSTPRRIPAPVWAVGGLFILLLFSAFVTPRWGFFGHRRINRLAVFTLPAEMGVLYKKHIEYLTEHAVDPDKRRYASRHEAPRHYIDLDHYGVLPFDHLPRTWPEALARFSDLYLVTSEGDTVLLLSEQIAERVGDRVLLKDTSCTAAAYWPEAGLPTRQYQAFFNANILPAYYEDSWSVDCDSLKRLFGRDMPCRQAFAVDRLSEHGILPYNLLHAQQRLTEAFRAKDVKAILRQSAEIGHYIGDAHVPLHTTKNYNGQLTGQLGIHAFWESRIPELFADAQYDFFVGPATYIADPREHYWQMVFDSHVLVDSVLLLEKELTQAFPPDRQFCFEDRLGQTIRTQCSGFAAAYQARMRGMVERRMRQAIHAIGSAWYTAWVDAGQPDLRRLMGSPEEAEGKALAENLEKAYRAGKSKGRPHE